MTKITTRKFIQDYSQNIINLINTIVVTDRQGKVLCVNEAVEIASDFIKDAKVFYIGNGGSAAIASHMAIDCWKNAGIPAMAFNDGPSLTCISNDYGYEYMFSKPIEMFMDKSDTLFAISSSGKSGNILKGVETARQKGCRIITLSGFKKDNPLKGKGDYNFFVSSMKYGPVEIVHQYICHWILDSVMAGS